MASRKELRNAALEIADKAVTYEKALIRRSVMAVALAAASIWQSALVLVAYLKTL